MEDVKILGDIFYYFENSKFHENLIDTYNRDYSDKIEQCKDISKILKERKRLLEKVKEQYSKVSSDLLKDITSNGLLRKIDDLIDSIDLASEQYEKMIDGEIAVGVVDLTKISDQNSSLMETVNEASLEYHENLSKKAENDQEFGEKLVHLSHHDGMPEEFKEIADAIDNESKGNSDSDDTDTGSNPSDDSEDNSLENGIDTAVVTANNTENTDEGDTSDDDDSDDDSNEDENEDEDEKNNQNGNEDQSPGDDNDENLEDEFTEEEIAKMSMDTILQLVQEKRLEEVHDYDEDGYEIGVRYVNPDKKANVKKDNSKDEFTEEEIANMSLEQIKQLVQDKKLIEIPQFDEEGKFIGVRYENPQKKDNLEKDAAQNQENLDKDDEQIQRTEQDSMENKKGKENKSWEERISDLKYQKDMNYSAEVRKIKVEIELEEIEKSLAANTAKIDELKAQGKKVPYKTAVEQKALQMKKNDLENELMVVKLNSREKRREKTLDKTNTKIESQQEKLEEEQTKEAMAHSQLFKKISLRRERKIQEKLDRLNGHMAEVMQEQVTETSMKFDKEYKKIQKLANRKAKSEVRKEMIDGAVKEVKAVMYDIKQRFVSKREARLAELQNSNVVITGTPTIIDIEENVNENESSMGMRNVA